VNPEDFHDPVPTVEQGRFPYLIEAKITNIGDDQGIGRVKAKLRGMDDGDETEWLNPAWPGSIEAIPNKGEQVWVQFVEGDTARGVYWWFPIKNTQGRPTEAMVLGTTHIAMINFFVTQFNQLRTDFNSHTQTCSGSITGTANLVSGAVTGTYTGTAAAPSPTAAVAANKGKASDGSVVADKSTSEVVLSGKLNLR
jgi:hypothetical protein